MFPIRFHLNYYINEFSHKHKTQSQSYEMESYLKLTPK